MTQKELGELRRHWTPDRAAVTTIYGCYVNAARQIVSYLDESVELMPEEERDTYFGLLKKSLSGSLGRNLIDIVFSSQQVMHGEEHALLMKLRRERLGDAAAREELYQKIIASVDPGETGYVILLACDTYDVPHKGKDEANLGSESQFTYLLCAVCYTRLLRQEMQFYPAANEFHLSPGGQVMGPNEMGFLFPAFDSRAANIYNALFYTRDSADIHGDFISGVFNTALELSAEEQREAFEEALTQTLGEDCGFGLVQSVNERLANQIKEHKEEKIPEPLALQPGDIGAILADCGVAPEKVDAFTRRCTERLGEGTSIRPENVIDSKKFVIKTDALTVSLTPEESFRLETRVIDGRKCLVIPVGDTVEINGMETSV